MKPQLYICSDIHHGADPFAIVATADGIYDAIADAVHCQSGARVLRFTVDNGNVWAYCYDDCFGEFTIIAEHQKEIYGIELINQIGE
jgi:hypothetical protein